VPTASVQLGAAPHFAHSPQSAGQTPHVSETPHAPSPHTVLADAEVPASLKESVQTQLLDHRPVDTSQEAVPEAPEEHVHAWVAPSEHVLSAKDASRELEPHAATNPKSATNTTADDFSMRTSRPRG